METLQYALIFQCARVAKANDRQERISLRLYLANCLHLINKKVNGINFGGGNCKVSTLLKVESFTLCRRLRPYCLYLLDDYRITSKTFYVVFANTAGFFMMLFSP